MKKEFRKKIIIFSISFIVSYILIFLLGQFVFKSIGNTFVNHILIISFFVLSFFLFDMLQKEIKFSFSEYYVGLILLILMYFGYYLAYWIYYRKVVLSSLFSYLFLSPFLYVCLGFFFGWITFMLCEQFKK